MKCIVCVKQVPDTANVEVDPVTGVLKRDGTQSKLNPYDLYAMESALGMKEQQGGTVDVITMGPGQAREALKECMCMGADRAGLISDRKFAGADVVATSYTLSQGIRRMGEYDLILCGKQTTDGILRQWTRLQRKAVMWELYLLAGIRACFPLTDSMPMPSCRAAVIIPSGARASARAIPTQSAESKA